jgi:SAM-dependent methyltransferase
MDNDNLNKILAAIDDASLSSEILSLYENDNLHARALKSFIYANRRTATQTKYFDRLYKECFSIESIQQKKFINFGPGSFNHRYWTTADKLYLAHQGKQWSEIRGKAFSEKIQIVWDMYACRPVEVENDSFEIAYASHVIEHAWDAHVAYFLQDVLRILKPGGVFRVTAPNINLGIEAARRKDFTYYAYSQYLRSESHTKRVLGKTSERLPIAYWILEQCSLITNPRNSYHITPEECEEFLWSSDVYESLTKASQLSDIKLNEELAAHVNWFNHEKIEQMLKAAGFNTVIRSGYLQSVAPILRDVRYFDTTMPQMSFYVDAIK